MNCNFSYKHYREILKEFKGRGYVFYSFEENDQEGDKVIYLRHDLDHSIRAARSLAYIERDEGIKATYCVRFACDFYNPISAENINLIREIISCGHDIGLHFDKQVWTGKLEYEIKRQLNILNYFYQIKNIVSFHRPNDIFNKSFKGFVNTYDESHFRNVRYLSDSTGVWRDGCVCQWIKKSVNRFQILTHPFWWGREEMDSCKHIHNFLRETMLFWDQKIYEDNPFYSERLKL